MQRADSDGRTREADGFQLMVSNVSAGELPGRMRSTDCWTYVIDANRSICYPAQIVAAVQRELCNWFHHVRAHNDEEEKHLHAPPRG